LSRGLFKQAFKSNPRLDHEIEDQIFNSKDLQIEALDLQIEGSGRKIKEY